MGVTGSVLTSSLFLSLLHLPCSVKWAMPLPLNLNLYSSWRQHPHVPVCHRPHCSSQNCGFRHLRNLFFFSSTSFFILRCGASIFREMNISPAQPATCLLLNSRFDESKTNTDIYQLESTRRRERPSCDGEKMVLGTFELSS